VVKHEQVEKEPKSYCMLTIIQIKVHFDEEKKFFKFVCSFSAPINWSLKPFHKLFLNLSFQDSILSKVYNKQSIAANQQKIRLTLPDRMGLKKSFVLWVVN
jgi:hypothetical protein